MSVDSLHSPSCRVQSGTEAVSADEVRRRNSDTREWLGTESMRIARKRASKKTVDLSSQYEDLHDSHNSGFHSRILSTVIPTGQGLCRDGTLEDRNAGQYEHNVTQRAILLWFHSHSREWN